MRTLQQPPVGYAFDQPISVYRNGDWVKARYSHTDKAGDIWARMEWMEYGRRVVVLEYFPPKFVRAPR